MSNNSDDSIILIPYNPEWPVMASEEISTLKSILRDEIWVVDIQHIGSTALLGATAKPIIDIYIGVTSIQEAQKSIKYLEQQNYKFWSDNPNKEKMFFVKGMPPFGSGRTHHVHIVEYDSHYWKARILFRDYLNTHPDKIKEYADLKERLMEQFKNDREQYTEAKSEFVTAILKEADFKEEIKR